MLGSSLIPFLNEYSMLELPGAAKPNFKNSIIDHVASNAPMMVIILETRVSTSGMDECKRYLNFDSAFGIDSVGLSGGLWMKSNLISVDILPNGFQAIHAIVKVSHLQHHWMQNSTSSKVKQYGCGRALQVGV